MPTNEDEKENEDPTSASRDIAYDSDSSPNLPPTDPQDLGMGMAPDDDVVTVDAPNFTITTATQVPPKPQLPPPLELEALLPKKAVLPSAPSRKREDVAIYGPFKKIVVELNASISKSSQQVKALVKDYNKRRSAALKELNEA